MYKNLKEGSLRSEFDRLSSRANEEGVRNGVTLCAAAATRRAVLTSFSSFGLHFFSFAQQKISFPFFDKSLQRKQSCCWLRYFWLPDSCSLLFLEIITGYNHR